MDAYDRHILKERIAKTVFVMIPLALIGWMIWAMMTSGVTWRDLTLAMDENMNNVNVRVVTVDGCEYLASTYKQGVPLVHKANCGNPIHKEVLR
jgi:hypothetical protein